MTSVRCFAAAKGVQSAARLMAAALVIDGLDSRGAHVPQEWCRLAQQFFKVASSDSVSGVTQKNNVSVERGAALRPHNENWLLARLQVFSRCMVSVTNNGVYMGSPWRRAFWSTRRRLGKVTWASPAIREKRTAHVREQSHVSQQVTVPWWLRGVLMLSARQQIMGNL